MIIVGDLIMKVVNCVQSKKMKGRNTRKMRERGEVRQFFVIKKGIKFKFQDDDNDN